MNTQKCLGLSIVVLAALGLSPAAEEAAHTGLSAAEKQAIHNQADYEATRTALSMMAEEYPELWLAGQERDASKLKLSASQAHLDHLRAQPEAQPDYLKAELARAKKRVDHLWSQSRRNWGTLDKRESDLTGYKDELARVRTVLSAAEQRRDQARAVYERARKAYLVALAPCRKEFRVIYETEYAKRKKALEAGVYAGKRAAEEERRVRSEQRTLREKKWSGTYVWLEDEQGIRTLTLEPGTPNPEYRWRVAAGKVLITLQVGPVVQKWVFEPTDDGPLAGLCFSPADMKGRRAVLQRLPEPEPASGPEPVAADGELGKSEPE